MTDKRRDPRRRGFRAQINSIRGRLILVTMSCLALFLLISAFVLERAFVAGLRAQIEARLSAHVYTLLTAADETRPRELFVPEYLPDERLNEFGSGLYAFVADAEGKLIWRSASAMNLEDPVLHPGRPGEIRFDDRVLSGEPLIAASYDAVWEKSGARYTFSIMQSSSDLSAAQRNFRFTLWSWLGGLSAAFLLALWWVVRWGTQPLRDVARAVRAVEAGENPQLEGRFPRELLPLTDNINLFIESERAQRQRYADTMANLAHSLKTPLAVLQGAAQREDDQPLRPLVLEQVERMNGIVRYQLQRAVARGKAPFASSIAVAPMLEKLADALRKVYAQRGLQIATEVEGDPRFLGESGDLMEVLGNLLDNACKWSARRVRCAVAEQLADGQASLHITVEDDGPGIAPEKVARVLSRGGRLDTQTEGQGIGLAVVQEIVRAYHGELQIGRSIWGGAAMHVRLPL